MKDSRSTLKRTAAGLARGTGWTLSSVVAALLIAFGIPLAWVWIASKLAGNRQDVTPSLALLITTGVLVSYWLALLIGGRLRGRWVSEDEERTRLRRNSWNRSFRDEPLRAANQVSDPIERLFVIVAVLGVVAFEVWFFFFAGSPLPSQPLF